MDKFSTSDEQRGLEGALFEKLVEQNKAIASKGFKTASMATKHADFTKDTYTKMSLIHGISEDKKSDWKEKAAAMSSGKEERLKFLSSIDGDHPEVRKYLHNSQIQQRILQSQMQRVCMGPMNQYRFTQCGELQNQFNAHQQNASELQSRFTLANNQNWNGIFSYWDRKNIPYQQNWHNTFVQPTQQNVPNSMGYMYDPKVAQYSNFDASKLYQPNAVAPEMNPLFTEHPYTVTPIVQ